MAGDVDTLRDMITDAERVVFFTGAGVSTESGIPDFRSPGGVWDRFKPIYFDDFMSSRESRRETWRRKIETDKTMRKAAPNRGHQAIASLVARGKASAIITQNIDGLHQVSGVPDDKVIELHGNSTYCTCLDCSERHTLEEVIGPFKQDETLPECKSCGSEYVKTATISFGQQMPEGPMRRAQAEAMAADLFIAIGSSLVVYPAAGFPVMAKQNGSKLCILNREPTELDQYADLVLNAEIGPILGAAVGLN
jgi:NAD-dependent deacetylase